MHTAKNKFFICRNQQNTTIAFRSGNVYHSVNDNVVLSKIILLGYDVNCVYKKLIDFGFRAGAEGRFRESKRMVFTHDRLDKLSEKGYVMDTPVCKVKKDDILDVLGVNECYLVYVSNELKPIVVNNEKFFIDVEEIF